MDPLAVLSGLGVGAIVGMTGVGGGSLMTPPLLGLFGLSPAVAIGTDLWFAGLTKAGGSRVHHGLGHIDHRVTRLLLSGSLPSTVLTIVLMHLTGITAAWSGTLAVVLGVALLLTALSVAYRRLWSALGLRLEHCLTVPHRDALTVASGALLLGSLPGIWLRARLTTAMPERLLRGALCLSLVGAGFKVLS